MDAYEDRIAENAAALLRSMRDDSPPTRRIVLTWPDPNTPGDAFECVFLPKHIAVLFERLEPGSEVEVTVRQRGTMDRSIKAMRQALFLTCLIGIGQIAILGDTKFVGPTLYFFAIGLLLNAYLLWQESKSQ